jgi:hypothetical protein
MARLPRYNLSGQPQHVILRGNNRCVIFAADEDYRFFSIVSRMQWIATVAPYMPMC